MKTIKIAAMSLFYLPILLLTGCASVNTQSSSQNISYEEMDASDFFYKTAQQIGWQGVTLTNAGIYKSGNKLCVGNDNSIPRSSLITIWEENQSAYIEGMTDAQKTKIAQNSYPQIIKDNLDKIYFNETCYTIKINLRRIGNSFTGIFTGFQYEPIAEIVSIEGIEQHAEKKRKEEENRIAREKAAAEREAAIDARGKSIARGYTYHGIDESSKNTTLFKGKAMSPGHAYYIPYFKPYKYAPSNTATILESFILKESTPIFVQYINNAVKAEILEAASFFNGYTDVSVVATIDSTTNIIVILGLVKKE